MRLIDADALCRTISLNIMAYKTLLNNKITIPNQIDKEKVNSVIDGFRECIDIVYHEPRVIAEPIRHGHWIRTEAYPHRVVCSECHKTYVRNENIIEGRYKGDEIVPIYCTEAEYCPHCGAKMDNTIINNTNDDIKTNDDEIIRCKDCKYWKEDVPHNAYCEFMKLHGFEPDDFCSKGVRKWD